MSTPPNTEDKSEKTPLPSNKRLQQTQAQVNEVVDIMRINVDKVLERDKNLSKLDNRADALQAGASRFEASAGKLKRKFWWRNCKMIMVLGTLITVLAIVLIVWVVSSQKREARLLQLEEEKRNQTLLAGGKTEKTILDNISKSGGKPGKESVPEFKIHNVDTDLLTTPNPTIPDDSRNSTALTDQSGSDTIISNANGTQNNVSYTSSDK